MSWLSLGLSLLGSYNSWKAEREEAKAVGRQMAEQATNAIRTMNFAFQNYEEERRDAFESALSNLEKLNINASGLTGSVDNAVSEEMGDSNTGRLLSRATHAEALRSALAEKDNYRRKSNEVDLNKEQQLEYTKSYTAGLHPPRLPSKGELFFRLANTGFNAYMQHKSVEAYRQSHFGTNKYSNSVVSYGEPMGDYAPIRVVKRSGVTIGDDPYPPVRVVRR
ncbi:virion core protein, T7 gp14 family [Veillonella intestinalis]|uniref:virion core protein, T7 gp14 family n=1 Tax=Veillonella intestinalis TaxID=2941341 RepID=UPI00203B4035|nr:hypothetical protein [Veillonella intestinalis]